MRILLLATLLTVPLTAQDNCRTPNGDVRSSCIHSLATDVTAESPIKGSGSGVRFEGTRDKSKVDAFIGYEITDVAGTYLKASTAIKETDESKTFSTLSGLTAGTSVSVGMYGILYEPNADAAEQKRVCDAYKATPEFLQKPQDERDTFRCTILTLPETFREQFKAAVNWGPTPTISGVQLTANAKEFEYFNTAFATEKKNHTGYGAKIAYGYFPRRRVRFFGGDIAYESAYKPQDPANICVPVPDSAATQCKTLAVGEPKHQKNLIVSLEARTFLGTRAGFIPRVHYEFKKRDVSIEVPIFFLHDADGAFNGGLTFAWQPEAKGSAFSANFFIGTLARAGRFFQ
jgi:hypothetical protein